MIRRVATGLIAAVVFAGSATAQDSAVMSAADSSALAVAMIQAAVHEGHLSDDGRLWIYASPRSDDEWIPSLDAFGRIQSDFPEARWMPDGSEPWECESGERPIFPGQSCPVRDNGVLLRFGTTTVEADGTVVGSLSIAACCAGTGLRLAFSRSPETGALSFVELRMIAIT